MGLIPVGWTYATKMLQTFSLRTLGGVSSCIVRCVDADAFASHRLER